MNGDEYQRAKNAALRLLGLCDRSRKDLKDRLFKKGCPPEVIEA
ncbi:MAG: recombination regulator RecX, partial [Nitrospirae bacterium]|nr:recombination regulator RecX [Nitrospirota bacterium]